MCLHESYSHILIGFSLCLIFFGRRVSSSHSISVLFFVCLFELLFSTPEKESILDAQSPSELKRKTDQRPEKQDLETNNDSNILSNDKTNADIKHVSGDLNADDLYALPNKQQRSTAKSAVDSGVDKNESKVYEVASDEEDKDECDNKHSSDCIEDKDANKDLPFGWEKHEDNDGPYYWHIKSGTIQREPPLFPKEPLTQSNEIKTPSSGLKPSPSLVHMQATSSVAKFGPHSQYHSGMGFNVRTQVRMRRIQSETTQKPVKCAIFSSDLSFCLSTIILLKCAFVLLFFYSTFVGEWHWRFVCSGNKKLISD